MKELYRYKVKRDEKKENRVANDDGTFTISIVTESIPVDVILKKPSRKDREEMAMIYNAEFHKCLNSGISTEEMIRRAVLDGGGGFIAKHDLERLHVLYKDSEKLKSEVLLKKTNGEDVVKSEDDLYKMYKEIYEIEKSQTGVFSHSAEALAARKSLIWAALSLTYLSEYERVFSGPTFESRLETYYEMCDDEEKHSFELGCFDRSYIFIERFLNGAAETENDFKVIEDELNEFFNKKE